MKLALPEVHILLETPGVKMSMAYEFYTASWSHVCEKVNNHNAKFVAGEVDTIMRVYCPWEGEELHVPR